MTMGETARNETTGDRITNIKAGSNKPYESGWDAIWGKKTDNVTTTDQPDQQAGGQDGESKG